MTICQQYSLLTLAVLLVTVFGYGPPVIAAEFQATVQVSSEYRSNVRLDPDIEIDDTENTAILELSLNQRYTQADLQINYQFEESQYQEETFEDRFTATGRGSLNLVIIPQRLTWLLENTREDSQISSLEPNVPINRTEVSTTVTGPTLSYDIGKVDTLFIDARYIKTENKELPVNDTDRTTGGLRWRHLLSRTKTLQLALNHTQVEYELEEQNFDSNNVRLTYTARWRRSETVLWAGLNRYDPELEESDTTNEYGLSWQFNRTPTEVLSLSAEQQFSDSSIGGSLSGNIDLSPEQEAIARELGLNIGNENAGLSDVYEELSYNLSFNRQLPQGYQISAKLTWQDRDYEQDINDQVTKSGSFSLEKTLSKSASLTFSALREIDEFEELDREDKDWTGRARYSVEVMPQLTLQTTIFYEARDSVDAAVEYDDYGAIVSLSYLIR